MKEEAYQIGRARLATLPLMGHAHIQTTMVYVEVTPLEVYQQYAKAVAQHIRPVPGRAS